MERRPVEMMASATLSDIVRTISDRRKSCLITFAATTGLLFCLIMLWPNRYESDGLMFVRLGRGAMSVDPTVQGSKTVSLMESRKSEVISVATMLSSREIAARVVDHVGLEKINQPRTWVEVSMNGLSSLVPRLPKSAEATQYDGMIDREDAIGRVQDWIEIFVPKDTYTVSVSGKGSDPVLVQEIVQAMMDQYQRLHVEAHQASGSLEFFEQQVAQSRQAAIESQRALQSTKAEMGWLNVASAEQSLATRISALELKRDEAKSGFAEADSHSEALRNRLITMDQWVPTSITKGIASKAGEDMRTALYAAQIESTEAMAKLKPKHPKYSLVRKTMQQSRGILDDETKIREQSLEAINPVFQQLQAEYEATSARAAGLESRFETLSKAVDDANQDLVRLNTDGIRLAELQWASDLAEQNLMTHSKSLEEARVASALDGQDFSDVSVIQPASLNLKKAGPPRLTLLVLSMMLGSLAAALQAILRQSAAPIWSETFTTKHTRRSSDRPQPVVTETAASV